MKFPPVARFKTGAEFAARLAELSPQPSGEPGRRIDCDPEILSASGSPKASPMAAPAEAFGRVVGNRWAIHPMEGWDGTRDGAPTEWTLRRWRNFGRSGAKLIWGGEAVAVTRAGRANPDQLFYAPENRAGLDALRRALIDAHRDAHGEDAERDLVVGLQLTHSGRFCRPEAKDRLEPRVAQADPILDARFGVDPAKALLTDGEIDGLIEAYVRAAVAARELGYDFVDVKHCHGYLLHELLGARTRGGRYGGSFENRTRALREIVAGIRRDAPGLGVGVRLSIYDAAPTPPAAPGGKSDLLGGRPAADWRFGVSADDPEAWDLAEPVRFGALCARLGIGMINVTAGSPYYSAHIQRPAMYPPVDGREIDRDPLIGAIRLLRATAEYGDRLAAAVAEDAAGRLGLQTRRGLADVVGSGEPTYPSPARPALVGTGYSYFQEYLPHVAQAQVRAGAVEFVGLGRVVLSNPTLPADTLRDGHMERGKICRTFSDCTNGPRMGFISGCYPLDPAYKALPEWEKIRARKKELERSE